MKTIWQKHFSELVNACESTMGEMIDASSYHKIPANTQVVKYGDICRNYILVASGRVRVQILTEQGREIVLYRISPGEGCVLTTSCLLGHSEFPAECYTEDQTEMITLPEALFERLLDESSQFRRFVFNDFAMRLANVITKFQQVCSPAVDRVLAGVLVDMIKDDSNRIVTTHHDLATEIGTAREVVSRHLKRFELQGWVRLERGAIEVLDQGSLMQLKNTTVA